MTAHGFRRTARRLTGLGCQLALLALVGPWCVLHSPQVSAADTSVAHPRVALVIGNANYSAVKPLSNSANDANDICDVLGTLGYKASCYIDVADRREFKARIQDFVASVPAKSDVLFYYAGHAVQLKGENYLVPTGARLRSEADIARETISLNYLMTQLSQAKHHLNIVVLDACRNNPWPENLRAAGSGLAPITAIPRGTMVLYATAANDVSGDGEGRNGTLTKNMLANINVPGLTIDDMFKRVSDGVQADSLAVVGHAQTPALYTNFTGEFCFAGCIDKVARAELEKMQKASQEQLEKARQEAADMQAKNAEMQAKLAATETSMNCDKSVLSDSGQCFTAAPDVTLRAATVALLQSGFTIADTDADGGVVQAVRKLTNPTNKNATDTVSATVVVREVPVTGHSVVTITANQQTTELETSHTWTQVVIIPVPTRKHYSNVVKKDTRVTDPQFYSNLFAAIERNLRSEASNVASATRNSVTPAAENAASAMAEIPAGAHPAETAAGAHPPETPAGAHPPETPAGAHPPETPAGAHPPETPVAAQPPSSGNQHHVGAPPERAMRATVEALVQGGYIVDSVDHSLGVVTATRRVVNPKDTRYSNNFAASAYVAPDPGTEGSRVQLSANEQRVLHRKSSKMFGKPEYQPAVVEHEGNVTDAGYYRGLFTAIEANLGASDATLPAHARRFGAPIERTLPAVIDGLAQRGFSIDDADKAVGFVTAHRTREDKAAGGNVRDSATLYVKSDSDRQSIVIVAGSERATWSPSFEMGSGSSGLSMLGLLGVARSGGDMSMETLGQTVVMREGEISDVAFYGNLFSIIDEKLRN